MENVSVVITYIICMTVYVVISFIILKVLKLSIKVLDKYNEKLDKEIETKQYYAKNQ